MGIDSAMGLPKNATITEVVTRDGFQDEPRIIPTHAKVRVIEGLVAAGVTSIEVTSFVHPKVVPQMADAEELLTRVPRRPGLAYSGLVANLKGAERAVGAGVDEIRLLVSASESHNRANLNRGVEESLAQLGEVYRFIRQANPGIALLGGVGTAFGCPFEGCVPLSRLVWVIEQFAALGITRIGLADTTGMANPLQVAQKLTVVQETFPAIEFGLHLHDTRGMALANTLAGLQAGVRWFDSSLGGLGGCPFAPGATGNVATEDLVHMLHEMGIETGIDLDALIAEARRLPDIVGHPLESHVSRAGQACELQPFEGVKVASSRALAT